MVIGVVITAVRRRRRKQKDYEFKASLNYILKKACLSLTPTAGWKLDDEVHCGPFPDRQMGKSGP